MATRESTLSVRPIEQQDTGERGVTTGKIAPASATLTIPAKETYLTAEDVARRYPGTTKRYFARFRFANGKRVGPPFIKVGSRPYYPLSLLIEWERRNLHVPELAGT